MQTFTRRDGHHGPDTRSKGATEPAMPYLHLRDVLTSEDLSFLKRTCKRFISREGIPCYVLIDNLADQTCLKLKNAIEQAIGESLYYLNDFYIYTDSASKTGWHMDTDLFTFDRAINAWILLAPDHVEDPLGIMRDINDTPERYFHDVKIKDGTCIFGNYRTGKTEMKSLESIEAEQIHTPKIGLGDILIFNPKQFHKTNVNEPKHALAVKFVLRGSTGFLSPNQLDEGFWPEIARFNRLVRRASSWDYVVDGLREALRTESGRKELTAGPYPGNFGLYQKMIASL